MCEGLIGYKDVTCGCTCAAAPKLISRADTELTHQFRMGLDNSFCTLCSQILSLDQLSTLYKAHLLVSQEERCKNIVQGSEEREVRSFAAQATSGEEKG